MDYGRIRGRDSEQHIVFATDKEVGSVEKLVCKFSIRDSEQISCVCVEVRGSRRGLSWACFQLTWSKCSNQAYNKLVEGIPKVPLSVTSPI